MNARFLIFFIIFNVIVAVYYVFHLLHIIHEVKEELEEQEHEQEREAEEQERDKDNPQLPLQPENVTKKEDVDQTPKPSLQSITPASLVKDEPIPRGMHVRINMQTGEREGRWLSEENNDGGNDDETSIVLSPTNDTDGGLDSFRYDQSDNDVQQVKKKFRSYEELKQAMDDLNLKVKTDMEVLTQHMKRFVELSSRPLERKNVDEIIVILKDFENLLHQVDNGQEFAKQNGMAVIVAPLLKSNVSTFRSLGANILGAAVQNNAKVQVAALKASVIPLLLHNIASSEDFESRSSSLFALSCLVRSFPLAEMKLIEDEGLPVLMGLFDDQSTDGVKLQLKVVTFLSDLIIEKEDAKVTMEEKEKQIANVTDELPREEFAQIMEKFRQYSVIELNNKLFELDWCKKLGTLLTSRSFKANVNHSIGASWLNLNETDVDHDIVDKVVSATLPVAKHCRDVLVNDDAVVNALPYLLKYYKNLSGSETDTDDTFYHDIYYKINQLSVALKLK